MVRLGWVGEVHIQIFRRSPKRTCLFFCLGNNYEPTKVLSVMEVFKGTTNHWQTDTGSMLNIDIECSALLGGKRNATVRAVTDRVEVLVLLQKDLIMLDQACVAGIETLATKRRESNSRREEEEDEEIVVVEEEEEE
jgi:hypothetical protein